MRLAKPPIYRPTTSSEGSRLIRIVVPCHVCANEGGHRDALILIFLKKWCEVLHVSRGEVCFSHACQ